LQWGGEFGNASVKEQTQRMVLSAYDVSRDLADLVDGFWAYRGGRHPVRVLPDGCMDLLFDLSDSAGHARLVGTMTRAELVPGALGQRYFGVRFRPAEAMRFLHGSADAFVDSDVALPELGRRFDSLSDAVLSARSDTERIRRVQNFLLDPRERVRATDRRVRAAVELLKSSTTLSVVRVAQQVGVGGRQLERLFAEHVGVRPKLFARIARLQRATALLGQAPQSLSALALGCGYADSAHFTREVRELSGVTPTQWLRERRVGFVQDIPDAAE